MNNNSSDNKNKFEDNNSWMAYVGLGTQLAVTVAAFTFLGIWLDKKYNTQPVLTVVLSIFGIAAGMYNFLKTVLKSR